MAIIGAHMLLYTPEAEAVREVLTDVFGLDHVDAGGGWLIFALPPAEIAVHPSDGSTEHAVSFMCDDIEATIAELTAKGLEVTGPPVDQGYGISTTVRLPGGVEVDVYEPRHASPLDIGPGE